MVIYTKYNPNRKEKFQLVTKIEKENGVIFSSKTAGNKKAEFFLMSFFDKYDYLKNNNFSFELINPGKISNSKIIFEYKEGKTIDSLLFELAQKGDRDNFIELLKKYAELIRKNKIKNEKLDANFVKIFGGENEERKFDCVQMGCLDLNFDNIILEDDGEKFFAIDYEWTFEFPIPYKYVLFRAITAFYGNYFYYNLNNKFISLTELYNIFEITEAEKNIFIIFEYHFQQYVLSLSGDLLEVYKNNYYNLELELSSNDYGYVVNIKERETQQKEQLIKQQEQIITEKDQELLRKEQIITEKDQELLRKEQIITEKEQTVVFMQSSKFWKLRVKYLGLTKNFNANLFFRKYLKICVDRIKPFVPLKLRRKFGNVYNDFFSARRTSVFHLPIVEVERQANKNHYFDIFNFSIIDWNFRTQRPQHLCREIVKKNNRVFYVATTFVELGRVGLTSDEISKHIQVRKIDENIFEVVLVSKSNLNIYKDIIDDIDDLNYLRYSIDALKDRFNIRHSISIVDLPFWRRLVDKIDKTKIIYDCMDDHGGFENNEKEMLEEENDLLSGCDVLLTSSDILYNRGIKKNSNVLMVKNACEYGKFSNVENTGALGEFKGDIVGYYGAIAEWFDFDLLRFCAEKMPETNFILIGNVSDKEKISEFGNLKNVYFLGEKPYSEIPNYLAAFDVCLIPFKIIPLTLATNPVKFFEYISNGKPVVSVDLPELREYGEIAYITKNKEKFLEGIQMALNERKNPEMMEKRIIIAKENTWAKRADIIWKEIDEKLFPKVSIIVVTYNNLDYTKSCLESIFLKTSYPNYELIIVDNNSSDETSAYLRKIEKENVNVSIILNNENRGFAGGNNDGLNISIGKYIVLLNNDTIVTENWIEDLKIILDKNDKLGVIGPVSNSVGNVQMIPVQYFDVERVHAWAKEYTSDKKHIYIEIEMVGFFCVMLKRETFEKVGMLDENFGIGMFEDDDYCMRVKNAGYNLGYTHKVFVHHFGSASFKKIDDEKFKKNWDKNKEYFEKKWEKEWKVVV